MKKTKIIPFLIALILLPFSVWGVQKTIQIFTKAGGVAANITVDTAITQESINPFWKVFTQGGEEKYPFENILPEIKALNPQYIRVDHIYDFYNPVQKRDNKLIFDWMALDKLIDQILASGALPFLSLSYMPPVIAKEGNPLNPPENWEEWKEVVKETIQHYSGKEQRSLPNVIYEVWNEPDLFGEWKIGREKNYCLLYQYAVEGAKQVKNSNPFKIGGPGVTALYKNWLNNFLDFVSKNNLRIDFYSWHRYALNPSQFIDDVNKIDSWLFEKGGFFLEKYLTEWGSTSENSPLHDSNFDAAHLVATIRQLLHRVDFAFTFEIKDGAPPEEEKEYWGRWGILTFKGNKKPKYYAFELLNQMKGKRLKLEGEGTWVTGFATKDEKTIKIILTNLDPDNQHFETVPLTLNNLENGVYLYQEFFLGGITKETHETIENNTLKKFISLSPNNIVLVKLTKI